MRGAMQQSQQGSVLMVSLVILLVLTLLGISGMESTIMQTRMAGNMQDMTTVFQAAEAGLRDAEGDIQDNISSSTVFRSNCTSGRCEPADREVAPPEEDVWDDTDKVNWTSGTNTVAYGANTGATALVDVHAPPRYIIERLQTVGRGNSIKAGFGAQQITEWYRVTAVGYGADGTTPEVMLQSVVRK